jgi:hypothetical protein
MDLPAAVARVKTLFESFEPQRGWDIASIYDDAVVFQDPFHRIEGRAGLEAYFAKMAKSLKSCRFHFTDTFYGEADSAMLVWTMDATLARPAGMKLSVAGSSLVRFTADGKVRAHRDYFDAGEMLYEKVPGLGLLIRGIKRAL